MIKDYKVKNTNKHGDTDNPANKVFDYLYKVRTGGVDNEEPTSERSPWQYNPRFNADAARLTSPVPHIDKDKKAFESDINFDSIMPKRADAMPEYMPEHKTWGNRNSLGGWQDKFRKYTGSPLVASALLGLGVGGTQYLLANRIGEWMGDNPVGRDPKTGEPIYVTPEDRKRNAILWGAGAALLNSALHFHPGEWSSLYKYSPKSNMRKTSSMLGPVDYVPLGMAQQAIMQDTRMTNMMKSNALNMLGSISNNPNTMISSTDMVGAAIQTGASANAGAPLGRMAAAATADYFTGLGIGKLLGMNNPQSLATAAGVGSGIVRGLGFLLNGGR